MQEKGVSPVGEFFHNKWVRLVLVFDLLVVIFIIVMVIINASKTSSISFNVTPVNATITVNGSGNYTSSGQAYSFAPGHYEVQISHPDLTTKTFSFDLESKHNMTITTFLSKDGDFDYYTLRDNLTSFEKLSEIASKNRNQTTDRDTSAEAFIEEFQTNYNLYLTKLPINYTRIGEDGRISEDITIKNDGSCSITLCVKALMYGSDDHELIKKLLEEKGFNTEILEIEYKTY